MRGNAFQAEGIVCVKARSRKRIGCLKNSQKGSVPGVWGARGQWLGGRQVTTFGCILSPV